MAELLFYQKPVVLNRDQHKHLRLEAVTDFSFTKEVNSVPMLGVEFFEASRDLPVLFSKDEQDNLFPVALLSLTNKGHDQVTQSGEWIGSYIPAFIRRYPFALTDDRNVCFDEASAALTDSSGEELFDQEGNNSDTLENALNFLNQFDAEHQRTQAFCSEIKRLELLKPFSLKVMTADRSPILLEGLQVIDEQKLEALDSDDIYALFKSGHLAWVYAHLHSLGALKILGEKLNTRKPD